ncbi:hypothetical protein KGQ19_16425 [Catenulispora sp. NL8]|uniref:Secreted protein n=1 Tax=Catenulispora pinistramenti TaxID=2705254 RepID=A0ABS5KR19_9ACTN|nr:hypothetical protein [Catenulispora pinistramenti]MBS2548454.1 hypothetical protein [Catenulispora pinistramenti]
MSMVMRGRAVVAVLVAAPAEPDVPAEPAEPAEPDEPDELAETCAGNVGTWACGLAEADEHAARASAAMAETPPAAS